MPRGVRVIQDKEMKWVFLPRWIWFIFPLFALQAKTSPDLFSVGAGAFDFMRERHRTWQFEADYKFYTKYLSFPKYDLEIRPLVGLMGTIRGSVYACLGIDFDLLFWDHVLVAPGFAAGYCWQGHGKDLGYPIEFRSGIELAWQFSDWHRLGVHFYHLSNASIGHRNPGEESIVLFYAIPVRKGFPFYSK